MVRSPVHFGFSPSRAALVVAVALAGCADDAEALRIVRDDPPDLPIRGLPDAWSERFAAGDAEFEAVFRASQGLGPLYIRHSCASCHADDARGPGAVRKFVLVEADGVTPRADQSALEFGHTARTQLAGGARTPIAIPERDDLLVTSRLGPAVFGRGYLEAVLDSEIERVAAEQATRTDGISGRPNRVPWQSEANDDARFHSFGPGSTNLIGRFGFKGRIATLDEFTADAYQGDMGITSPLRPVEPRNPDALDDDLAPGLDVDLETVNVVADYVRLLAIPRRDTTPGELGERIFLESPCAVCHTPSLRTRADYPVEALRDIDAPIYSDLLLHDMGRDLADGLAEFEASPREWKTAPLLGLRHLRAYLHDGRAATLDEAIVAHRGEGSEANGAVDHYEALSARDRDALLDWLRRL